MEVFRLGAALALMLSSGFQDVPGDDHIYGRVLTSEGEVLEGYLRWDRNEASWSDFLDGEKEIPWAHLRQAEELDPEYAARARRERTLEAFGVRITWDEDDDASPTRTPSAMRFGHIASIQVLDDRRANVTLRSGREVELFGTSTDLGRGLRALVVEDVRRGTVELRWRELERVDFLDPAPGGAAPTARRIQGTIRTWSGLEFTGFVAWDLDEVFASDVLDGRQDGEDHEIPFSEIRSIEWESSRSSRVTLASGEVLVLRGTNDVDRDNRGIEVSDPNMGRAIVPWREFERIDFRPVSRDGVARAFYDGGTEIRGTVRASDGRVLTGNIRWDNDEELTWEVLDGSSGGVDLDIEFGRIRSIVRGEGGEAVTVTLRDGRTLELEGANDVDLGNKGVFVHRDGGGTFLVKWRDFERVDFP
jgi:hypothetical protein